MQASAHALPQSHYDGPIHCVTTWSKFDMHWRGVSLDTLFATASPVPNATHVLARSSTGYTTNLPLDDVTDGKAWVAFEVDGKPLSRVHGGPARLLVPHLYFWKRAKFISGITVLDHDEPGFWEVRGYHDRGDPRGRRRRGTRAGHHRLSPDPRRCRRAPEPARRLHTRTTAQEVAEMNSQPSESTRQLEFMAELVNSHTAVAGDIVQIGLTTWGIHGSIPIDGEVLVAEYPSIEEASAALAVLAPNLVLDPRAQRGDRRTRHSAPPVGAPAYFLGRDSATWRSALAHNTA